MSDADLLRQLEAIEELLSEARETVNIGGSHPELLVHTGEDDIKKVAAILIPGGQNTSHKCSLPFHGSPPHWTYVPKTCQLNNAHVFCKRHNLSVCVICGGNLI